MALGNANQTNRVTGVCVVLYTGTNWRMTVPGQSTFPNPNARAIAVTEPINSTTRCIVFSWPETLPKVACGRVIAEKKPHPKPTRTIRGAVQHAFHSCLMVCQHTCVLRPWRITTVSARCTRLRKRLIFIMALSLSVAPVAFQSRLVYAARLSSYDHR